MSDTFDPYHKWLAIPAEEQPPNHYRLLGVHLFEKDPDVIDSAADRQMGHVRRFATGQRGELSQKILNEISSAKVALLNPEKRAAYDATLRKNLAAKQAASKPIPTAQALPKAQAVSVASQSSPKLRTRGQQPQPASSSGIDIPIVDRPKSVAQRRRKKKSSPILTVIALLVVAGALIGVVATIMDQPADEPAKTEAKVDQNPNTNPQPKVIVRKNPVRPVGDSDDSEEEFGTTGGTGTNRVPGSGGGQGSFLLNEPMELLDNLDLGEAVVSGNGWTFENGVLTSGRGDGTRVQIPLPATEYVLNIRAERTSGNGQLYLGLPVRGGKVSCIIDITHERPPGVYASGFYDGSKNTLMEKTGSSYFANSGMQVVTCRVQNDQVSLHINGSFVGAWKRDSRPLESPEHWAVPKTDSLTVGVSDSTSDSTFRISQVECRPLERRTASTSAGPGSGQGAGQARLVQGSPVNLLRDLDLENAVVAGEGWKLEDGALTTGQSSNARIKLPLPVTEYILFVNVERVAGPGQFFLGLPVEGGTVGCSFDSVHEQPSGQSATGFYTDPNEALIEKVSDGFLVPGKTVSIACVMEKHRFLLLADGKIIGTWVRDNRPLSVSEHWSVDDPQMLILGAALSKFRITKLEYRPSQRVVIASTGDGPDTDKIVGAFGEKLPTSGGSFNGGQSSGSSAAGSESLPSGGVFNNFGEKKDPPAEEKQAETLAVLEDLFPDEFAAAKTTTGKLALGKKLFDTAQKTREDPVALYVLLTQSAHYAAEGGNAEVPMRALTELDRKYNVDIISLYVDTFDKALKGARAPAEHAILIQQVKQAITAAQAEDRFEEAEKLMRMAQSSARVTREADTIKEVAAYAKQLRDAQSEFEKVSEAKETLKADPDDPEANTQWGRYLCVVKNDFPQGMPHLVKGSDAQLKAAAEADLAMPRESKDQIAVGDKWFALADAASGMDETLYRLRAGYWYQRGALGLTGLEKTRIDKRLSDISKIDREGIPLPKATTASTSRPASTPITDSSAESTGRISMVGRGMVGGQDMGVLLTYELGQTMNGRAVREALNRIGVNAGARIEINLGGSLLLRQPTELKFRVAGGSSSGGVCYLQINRREVAAVGDDRNKDTTITQMLPAGVYEIGLRITGGDLGSCLLECTEAESDTQVPFRTELVMARIKDLPTRVTIDLGQLTD